MALFLAAILTALGAWLGAIAWRFAGALGGRFARMRRSALLRLACAALLSVPIGCAVAIALAPVSGSGWFGFPGLLKREELELSYLGWTLLPALSAIGLFSFKTGRGVARIVGACAAVSLGLFLFAAFGVDGYPEAIAAVQKQGGMGGRLLTMARRLTDRDQDGASALFGGGDCDDRDPGRNPAAIDIPGNGVDEDCSGADAMPVGASPGRNPGAATDWKAPAPLSLLIITIDSLRHDVVGYMGYPRPITPNLDALAAKAVVFERAYALSSFTGRSLAPIFIGKYPSETYCNNDHFTTYFPKNEMLAEILKKAGFKTAAVGSHFYFNGHGLDQGFDRYAVEVPPGIDEPDQQITSDRVADRAITILRDPSFSSDRFFLWLHFMDPHRDYLPHEGFPGFGTKPRDLYDGEVAFADFHVGRVLHELEARGLSGKTAILVTGDHGEAFGEHGIRFHGAKLWEEVVRVPLVVAVPGIAPARIGARVSHIDLLPTVCDILGVRPEAPLRGDSLVRLMRGQESGDRAVFIELPPGEYFEEMYAYLDEGYKLIHEIVGNRFMLFDLQRDPDELNDLSRTDTAKREEMKARYRALRAGLEQNALRDR